MMYRSYEDLADCVRRNAWKIPADVELIVGVPRSGMIPALMLAELLNKKCADLDAFIEGRTMSCGNREQIMTRPCKEGKVLVIDDTFYGGAAMRLTRERLAPLESKYEILYACVYAEGRKAKSKVDIYLEDIWCPGEKMWLYEWDILHHWPKKTTVSMWDVDGLLCKNPPDDRDTEAYEAYLPNAIPIIIPTTRVGAFVTYRLEKYRGVTEEWMKKQGIEYGELHMFNAPDRDTRNGTMSPAKFKARIYSEASWAQLFIESDAYQAERIFKRSGKPVFCYENGKLYM